MLRSGLIEQPVFFIGMPRSGTTVLFESFARHPELGWLSNYSEMWPRLPIANTLCEVLDNRVFRLRGHKKQYGQVRFGNRYFPQPVEAYAFWDYYTRRDFSMDYLLGEKAGSITSDRVRRAVGDVLKYQRKKRFATKLTGPGRIAYLASIFPDAVFIHVVRDGRSVIHSLLKVGFWKQKGGLERPFWRNGLRQNDLQQWNNNRRDPSVLAALQWARVLETTRQEASLLEAYQYQEIRYEDFVSEPVKMLSRLYDASGLEATQVDEYVSGIGADLRNMNKTIEGEFGADVVATLNRIMHPMLEELGYEC